MKHPRKSWEGGFTPPTRNLIRSLLQLHRRQLLHLYMAASHSLLFTPLHSHYSSLLFQSISSSSHCSSPLIWLKKLRLCISSTKTSSLTSNLLKDHLKTGAALFHSPVLLLLRLGVSILRPAPLELPR